MSNLYLVRNLLSLKAAKSINDEYFSQSANFSVIDTNQQLKDIILKNIDANIDNIELTIKMPVSAAGLNILKQRKQIKEAKKMIGRVFSNLSIGQVFITYPMHFDSYLYYLVAKNRKIKISFYEEGPCFYRAGTTKQYDVSNTKDLIKRLYFDICGLKRGYNFKPDDWYCSLEIKEQHNLIKLRYEKVNLPANIKFVFLSRPVSEDHPEITVADEIEAIRKFYNMTCNGEVLHLKFHPRESEVKKSEIQERLRSIRINTEIIKGNNSSEDVIYSMKSGAVCGYDTTTLVYANNINKKVDVYSVLKEIIKKESSGFLTECYQEYKLKYKHIHMIE